MFYIPFNIIKVILRWWQGDNERLSAMKCHTVMNWILLLACFKHGTSCPEPFGCPYASILKNKQLSSASYTLNSKIEISLSIHTICTRQALFTSRFYCMERFQRNLETVYTLNSMCGVQAYLGFWYMPYQKLLSCVTQFRLISYKNN